MAEVVTDAVNHGTQLQNAKRQSRNFAIAVAVVNLCVTVLGGLTTSRLISSDTDKAVIGIIVVVAGAVNTFVQALKGIWETELKIQDNAKAMAIDDFVNQIQRRQPPVVASFRMSSNNQVNLLMQLLNDEAATFKRNLHAAR